MEHDLSLRGAEAQSAPVATLCAMFDHAIATAPDKVALRHLDVALTYREVGRAAAALAQRLAPIVKPGSHGRFSTPFPSRTFKSLRKSALTSRLQGFRP
jgi:long-chain acyl-CoA synthetase